MYFLFQEKNENASKTIQLKPRVAFALIQRTWNDQIQLETLKNSNTEVVINKSIIELQTKILNMLTEQKSR